MLSTLFDVWPCLFTGVSVEHKCSKTNWASPHTLMQRHYWYKVTQHMFLWKSDINAVNMAVMLWLEVVHAANPSIINVIERRKQGKTGELLKTSLRFNVAWGILFKTFLEPFVSYCLQIFSLPFIFCFVSDKPAAHKQVRLDILLHHVVTAL